MNSTFTSIAPIHVQNVIVRSDSGQARPSVQNIVIDQLYEFSMDGHKRLYFLAWTESGMGISARTASFNNRNFHTLYWRICGGQQITEDIYNDYHGLRSIS